jgi:hypothetical protein
MRDGNKIKGRKIWYMNNLWEIGDIYSVPGNSELYVQLKDNLISMNVRMEEVKKVITETENNYS